MRKFLVSFLVLSAAALPALAGNINVRGCGEGYGPAADNLMVLLDDDQPSTVDRVGYNVDGEFFEMSIRGCSELMVSPTNLVCDGTRIGSVGPVEMSGDDTVYNGRRASVRIDAQYEITGSCGGRIVLTISR